MLEHLTPELRHELASLRVAGLHRSAEQSPPASISQRSARSIGGNAHAPAHPDPVVRTSGT
jgi:hypothetical protein